MINSHFHHGHIGHLLKSRATVSHIINSRLVDGEGYKWPHNVLYLANNTLVNPLPHGVFLRVAPGADAVHDWDNVRQGPQPWFAEASELVVYNGK